MVIDLLGVLESGGAADPGVPADVRRPLVIPAGATVTLRLHAITRAGLPVVLAGGDSITMTIRESTTRPSRRHAAPVFTADTDRGPGYYTTTIAPATTRGLDGLRGIHDVWLTRAGGSRDPLIPTSELRFAPAAADPPAGA